MPGSSVEVARQKSLVGEYRGHHGARSARLADPVEGAICAGHPAAHRRHEAGVDEEEQCGIGGRGGRPDHIAALEMYGVQVLPCCDGPLEVTRPVRGLGAQCESQRILWLRRRVQQGQCFAPLTGGQSHADVSPLIRHISSKERPRLVTV